MDPTVTSATIAAIASVTGVVLVVRNNRRAEAQRHANAMELAAVSAKATQISVSVNGNLSSMREEMRELMKRAERAEGREEGRAGQIVETAAALLVHDPRAEVFPVSPAVLPAVVELIRREEP